MNIPDRFRAGFEQFAALDADRRDGLIRAIDAAEMGEGDLASRIDDAPLDIEGDSLREIVRSLVSLLGAQNVLQYDDAKLADELVKEMRLAEIDPLASMTDGDLDALRASVRSFLGLQSVRSMVEAGRLWSDYERTFCTSAIQTDLRPIFSGDVKEVIGVGIVHTLKITYHEGSAHEDTYFVLDREDLTELQAQIDRALGASATAAEYVAKSGARPIVERQRHS